MRGQIRNIRQVARNGAHGDPTKEGVWTYGRRPDGRTVACRTKILPSGNVLVISTWRSPSCGLAEFEECVSEFTAEEWRRILDASETEALWVCNRILDARNGSR
jgi:hypothetical protein